MRRRRLLPLDVAVVVASLLGVGALHLLSAALEPPLVLLADAPKHEGERVAFEARVLRATPGGLVILAQDGARVNAFSKARVGAGDQVRAVGVLNGGALSVESIVVLQKAAIRPIEPADLAASPRDFEGARVLVRGEARDGALVGGGARVRVMGEPAPVGAGSWLVSGTFRYHEKDASFVLVAESWTRSS